jgi:uncharacterized protein YggE
VVEYWRNATRRRYSIDAGSQKEWAMSECTCQPEHAITVSGSGLVSVAPDVADVTIGVSVTKSAVKDARNGAAAAMIAVVAAVKKAGIADKDVQTLNLNLSPVYNYDTGGSAPKLVGYQFSNTVKITVRDLEKLSSVIDESAMVGATTIQGISFRIDKPKEVEVKARQLAMTDARAKADALAQSAGVTIKGVASISEGSSEGPMPPRPMFAMARMKDAAESTPVEMGTTDVEVFVTVGYLIG